MKNFPFSSSHISALSPARSFCHCPCCTSRTRPQTLQKQGMPPQERGGDRSLRANSQSASCCHAPRTSSPASSLSLSFSRSSFRVLSFCTQKTRSCSVVVLGILVIITTSSKVVTDETSHKDVPNSFCLSLLLSIVFLSPGNLQPCPLHGVTPQSVLLPGTAWAVTLSVAYPLQL